MRPWVAPGLPFSVGDPDAVFCESGPYVVNPIIDALPNAVNANCLEDSWQFAGGVEARGFPTL